MTQVFARFGRCVCVCVFFQVRLWAPHRGGEGDEEVSGLDVPAGGFSDDPETLTVDD